MRKALKVSMIATTWFAIGLIVTTVPTEGDKMPLLNMDNLPVFFIGLMLGIVIVRMIYDD